MGVAVAALVVGGVGGATAATGGSFLLGKANTADRTTTLSNSGKGPALTLKAPTSKTPPFAVSNQTKVANLNADLLDGLDAKTFQRQVSGGCGTGITSVTVSGQVGCASGPRFFQGAGDHVYTVPANANSVLVQVWGAGGGGGYPITWAGSSGGGQGSYVEALLSVSPGDQLLASVGVGGNGGVAVGGCCTNGTAGAASTVSFQSQIVVSAPGGQAGATVNSCPNTGFATGGAGGGRGTVSAPAVGISTEAGAAGGGSHSSDLCGGGDGAGGSGGGGDGFAGSGGAGKNAITNVLVNGDNGSSGLIIITVIG